MLYWCMSYDDLNKNGYRNIKIPKYLLSLIKKSILLNINYKFKKNFKSYKFFNKHLKTISNKEFIKKFGPKVLRNIDSKCAEKINLWVKKNVPKKINFNKASLNMITKLECSENEYLKKDQFCAFYRIVRKNKKDVGHPHKDSSFMKLGIVRKAKFKPKSVWKCWIPLIGVNNQNTLNMIKSSHKDNINIEYVKKNGATKPKVPENYIKINSHRIVKPIKHDGSEGVLFHPDTVPFANVNKTTDFRISIEFNIFVK